MRGRVCLITGASSGIGRATATELARQGATVALVCRNQQRAEETQSALRAATGNDAVEYFLADLSSQADIRRVAQELANRYPQIHVLINNAGVFHLKRTTTIDGIETVFAVNHLAYFLLTHLLLDRLVAGQPARIINVASTMHRSARLDFDDLQNQRRYRATRAYAQSKLCNVLFTRELARRLAGTGVTANCVHPGGVATGLGWDNGRLAMLFARALRPFLRTPEQGADTVVYVATSPQVTGISGQYFADRRAGQPAPAALDEATAKRLWEISGVMTQGKG